MAYPVSPPSDIPTDTIIPNTKNLSNPPAIPSTFAIPFIANTNTNVPIASLKIFSGRFGTDGLVENAPNFAAGSGVASNCSLNKIYTRQAPTNAPAN